MRDPKDKPIDQEAEIDSETENLSAQSPAEAPDNPSEDEPEEVLVPDHFEDDQSLMHFLRQEHRFFYMALLLIILSVIGVALLVRTQNVDLSRLNESVASLSHFIRNWTVPRNAEVTSTGQKVYRRANQAWSFCQEQGGQSAIAKRPDGAEYGLCLFGADRQCEEWAMLHGDCPIGGVDISQYGHPADVYCVVTGHQVATSLVPGRSGECLVNGERCDADVFYNTGKCDGE